MRDVELYAQILGLSAPWEVTAVDLDRAAGQLVMKVSLMADAMLSCRIADRRRRAMTGGSVVGDTWTPAST